MKNQMWAAIHDVFREMRQLRQKSTSVVAVQKVQMKVMKRGVQEDDIVTLRSEVRTKLDYLKTVLSESLTEREVYLVLFPIVIYFDEMVQKDILSARKLDWPPLQQELFSTSKGGEIFYEALDDVLRKPETIPFIYEVFYFCLNDGFQGKYSDNILKVKEYKDKLRAKIPIPKIEAEDIKEPGPNLMQPIRFPIFYYILSGVVICTIYFAIRSLARI